MDLVAAECERAAAECEQPSCTVSICTFSVGGTLPQLAACVTFRGVLNDEMALLAFVRVTLPQCPS